MHAAQLAELASLLAHHGPAMLYRHEPIPPEAVNQYWTASRMRLELWHQTLARFNRAKATGDVYRMRCWWEEHFGVLEEVIVSELLTRVVAALADGIDRRAERDDFSPIAQAIHLAHMEARNRVQAAILDRRGCSVTNAVRLNRLRRMTERWIDVIVGGLTGHDPELVRYGIDSERTRSHARESRRTAATPAREAIGWLIRSALSEGFCQKMSDEPSLPQANRAVADSVLLMLRSDLFDSVGSLKSLWMHRIENDANRTDQMIEEFMRHDVEESETASTFDLIHATALAQWFR